MRIKASVTVEAALICPLLCLILVGILWFTLQLYETVNTYAVELSNRPRQELEASELIRLEAVAEDIF